MPFGVHVQTGDACSCSPHPSTPFKGWVDQTHFSVPLISEQCVCALSGNSNIVQDWIDISKHLIKHHKSNFTQFVRILVARLVPEIPWPKSRGIRDWKNPESRGTGFGILHVYFCRTAFCFLPVADYSSLMKGM